MPFCTNCGKQNPDTNKFCIDCGKALVQTTKPADNSAGAVAAPSPAPSMPATVAPAPAQNQQSRDSDLTGWFTKNSRLVVFAVGGLLAVLLIYYIFLKHDAQKDGGKAMTAYCNCSENYNSGMIDANEDFVNSFSSSHYKKKQEARNKLLVLQNAVGLVNTACIQKAQVHYNQLRSRYTRIEDLSAFDLAYNSQAGACSPGNQNKLTLLYSEIESKIATIKDPEPDIEKIKTDLIGKTMPGWTFNALTEFTRARISNTTRGTGRIEYTLDLHLTGFRLKEPHDAQIIVTYSQGGDGWLYTSVKEVYYTYTNTAPVNSWLAVTPVQNCTYQIIDNGQGYWVQDGSFGPKLKGGGTDADEIHLKSSRIFLMSRENHPVELVFRYTPNN